MSTSSAESIPLQPDPGTGRRHSLIPPQDQVQIHRATSPAQGSTSTTSTAVHVDYFDRAEPTWVVNRYGRTVKLKPPFIDSKLKPITTSFADSYEPKNWTRLVHPEGALYWVYNHRYDGRVMPVYTDAYLCDEGIREEVDKFRDAILGKTEAELMPAEWELVLDLDHGEDPNEIRCYYYFVNHSNRTLFWLHEFDVSPLLNGLYDVKSMRRIQQALEGHYWRHWEMFPHDRQVPEKLLKELTGIMIHAGIDDMTSHGSTSVYTGEQLQQFISYAERISFVGGADGYSACIIGRLMAFFIQGRYINFFGQREARLSADQSVFDGKDRKEKRTWLIKTTSVLLFFAPEAHLKELETVYTDFVILKHKWSKFIYKTQNEWRELVRIGTVLLTANVAFLAIPSVDNSSLTGTNTGHYLRNPAQVTSFMSVIFSMGSMVTGQLLLRYHTSRPHDSADQVDKYLRDYHDSHRGLEQLAILYSLPYSFLLWAIATFFVAFVFVTLVDSEGNWQRYPTAAAMTIFFLLLVWCIWTTWEGRTRFVEWLRRFPRGSPTPNYGPRPPSPLQPNRGQPEQHNGQKTAQFHLIRMDSSRGLTSATQVY